MDLHTASEREVRDGRVVIYQRSDTMTVVWQARIAFPGQLYPLNKIPSRFFGNLAWDNVKLPKRH